MFEKFQEFKNEVENLTERKIKILRSNNGGEYTSKKLIHFCKEAGIKRELIVPNNIEQNGVAKRNNKTIEKCVKAMLHNQYLPQFLWGETCVIVFYLQNRSPHKILNNMTPKEEFTRNKTSVNHLRIFGFHVYIHILKDKRKKLDPANMKGIFIGYSASKSYRIYIKEDHQIKVSMDIIFDESIAYKK